MSELITEYTKRFNQSLIPAADALKQFLVDLFGSNESVSWISTRPKSIDRFLEKSEATLEGDQKYEEPLNQIQDQVGALIVTRFLSDVEALGEIVKQNFRGIERQLIEPASEAEFGYIGFHYILFLPTDVTTTLDGYDGPEFFELQIKTLFQYAWSETNHAIGYQRHDELTTEQKRMTAYIAAQAWGADRAVAELNHALANGEAHA